MEKMGRTCPLSSDTMGTLVMSTAAMTIIASAVLLGLRRDRSMRVARIWDTSARSGYTYSTYG